MILTPEHLAIYHPSVPGEHGERYIGYWSGEYDNQSHLPNPKNFVDEAWDSAERTLVATYLNEGSVFVQWKGISPCRICDKHVGSQCLTDGTFVWPQGFHHYVTEHAVRPPQEFINHIHSCPAPLRDELRRHRENEDRIVAEFRASDPAQCSKKQDGTCQQKDGWVCSTAHYTGSSCKTAWSVLAKAQEQEHFRHKQALSVLLGRTK